MLKFSDAQSLFSKAKDKKKEKLLEINTRLYKSSRKSYVISFNDKIIVEIFENDQYCLRNSGKPSAVVMRKINKYTPAAIRVKKAQWLLKDDFKFFNGALINNEGDLIIPEPSKKYNSNECKKCGLIEVHCKCPMTQRRYDQLKRQGEQHEQDYGYFPESIKSLLSRGVEKDG